MSVAERARELGVTEVLHYTSNRGVMGSVMKRALLSREQVEKDRDVAFIFEGVWIRKDPDWVNYISLSVSRINLDLLSRSRKNFPDFWWAVMSFDVDILDDEGIWFTTTNNIYPPCRRATGVPGFELMFGEPIPWGYQGSMKYRGNGMSSAWPTDRTAEVLYPERIDLSRLRKLYVMEPQHRRLVHAWTDTYDLAELPVEVSQHAFM